MEYGYGDSDNSNETLKANKAIVNLLKEGYNLPLHTVPKSACFNNNKSVKTYSDFVSESVQDLSKQTK